MTFFDETRSDINSFLIRLRLKLNDNANRYSIEFFKIQYAVGRLAGKAEQLIQLHIDRDTGIIKFQTLKKFTDAKKRIVLINDFSGELRTVMIIRNASSIFINLVKNLQKINKRFPVNDV